MRFTSTRVQLIRAAASLRRCLMLSSDGSWRRMARWNASRAALASLTPIALRRSSARISPEAQVIALLLALLRPGYPGVCRAVHGESRHRWSMSCLKGCPALLNLASCRDPFGGLELLPCRPFQPGAISREVSNALASIETIVVWIPDLTSSPLVDEMTANMLGLFGRVAGHLHPSVGRLEPRSK
jgi:hypothetical protein